jgi:hypothetical protein
MFCDATVNRKHHSAFSSGAAQHPIAQQRQQIACRALSRRQGSMRETGSGAAFICRVYGRLDALNAKGIW